jgi:hypothetical protein
MLREPANEAERHAQQRLAGMTEAIELLTSWADEVRSCRMSGSWRC